MKPGGDVPHRGEVGEGLNSGLVIGAAEQNTANPARGGLGYGKEDGFHSPVHSQTRETRSAAAAAAALFLLPFPAVPRTGFFSSLLPR